MLLRTRPTSATQRVCQTVAASAPAPHSAAQQPAGRRRRRAPPVSPVTSPDPVPDGAIHDVVVARRNTLLADTPSVVVRVRGVSYENEIGLHRQAVLAQLVPGQPVIVAREPSNVADPHALAIYTTDMQQLGYVGRNMQHHFPLPVCFGHVESVGRSQEVGLFGCSIRVQPSAHGVWLDLLPEAWQERTQLETIVGSEAWQRLQDQVLARHGGGCAISGCTAEDAPLRVVPLWGFRWDDYEQWAYLGGLLPVCEPLLAMRAHLAAAGGGVLLSDPDVQLLLKDKARAEADSACVVGSFGCKDPGDRWCRLTSLGRPDEDDAGEVFGGYQDSQDEAVDVHSWVNRESALEARARLGYVATRLLDDQQLRALVLLMGVMGWFDGLECLVYVLHAVQRRRQLEVQLELLPELGEDDLEFVWYLEVPTPQDLEAAAAAGVDVGVGG